MQFKQYPHPLKGSMKIILPIFLILPLVSFSQTTYLPEGSKEYILLDRLEIKAQKDSVLNFSTIKPFSRKDIIPRISIFRTAGKYDSIPTEVSAVFGLKPEMLERLGRSLTKVDLFNAEEALMNSSEWTNLQFPSKKTFLKSFYKTPANFYEVNTKDFFFVINPVFQYVVGKESNNSERIFLNTRGVTLRGMLANKIGFAASLTDNQERDPLYVQAMSQAHHYVPGEGFYKDFKGTGFDYFDGRGYITFKAIKYVDVQFGYDKNFIGNGYRSLFLSDNSSPYLFLKLNTRIWKFNYTNLFMELNSAQHLPPDTLWPKKYAVMHHLSLEVTKWLNVGAFEAITFGRANHFEFGYLNPVIFYRSLELQYGSPDKAHVGFDAKANVAKKFQFYGQLLIDEFVFSELKNNRGFWANKYAYQLGAKYIDAFNINNLDLQIESNRVRPFTYAHTDSVSNYTHYNQPLADPLGANFQEWIGVARYQPAPKWLLEAKAIYYMQGKDTSTTGKTYGSNIFIPTIPADRYGDYGYYIGSGIKSKTAYASLLISYEWKPNFFIELNGVYRKEGATVISPAKNTSVIYFGIRWNAARREFDY